MGSRTEYTEKQRELALLQRRKDVIYFNLAEFTASCNVPTKVPEESDAWVASAILDIIVYMWRFNNGQNIYMLE
jgi:hypothetical protein